MAQLKDALANDEAARKESAASRETSGGLPDVGLASILRKQTMSQNSNKETSIDITNKLILAEKNNLTNNADADVVMKSLDTDEHSSSHKIHSHDNVTEMLENDDSEIGKLYKLLIIRKFKIALILLNPLTPIIYINFDFSQMKTIFKQ